MRKWGGGKESTRQREDRPRYRARKIIGTLQAITESTCVKTIFTRCQVLAFSRIIPDDPVGDRVELHTDHTYAARRRSVRSRPIVQPIPTFLRNDNGWGNRGSGVCGSIWGAQDRLQVGGVGGVSPPGVQESGYRLGAS
jgi:hypothetical protein